ncbi:inositol-pentakisphosphate 2-kinase [Mycena filopes]|nr:inositol-pentakisphosphate 2-kinase [Mycena filopes]
MPPTLSETSPSDWVYICDTIVLSYRGPPNPFYDGTVLRLRKRALADTDPAHDSEQDDPIIEFQEKCLERLVPSAHLPRMKRVLVGADSEIWLQSIAAQEKDCIDEKRLKAVLATDLVGGEGVTVEIKPKWGFSPSPTYLFCMHSHLKALSSSYCPLDLFSGDEPRMKKALSSLWDAWSDSIGTANNFRVFVEGKNITPEQQSFVGLVNDIADPKQAVITALLPVLLNTPVLRTISRLQRTLDALDIESLSLLCDLAPIGAQPTIAEWRRFIDAYLATPTSPPPTDAAHLRCHVLAYLLSATFKDCSILVRVPAGSVDRLRKWEQLNKKIVAHYATIPDPKVCLDG